MEFLCDAENVYIRDHPPGIRTIDNRVNWQLKESINMKLSLLLTTALVACASAAATVQSSELHTLEARACGAAGSCRGFGGGDLCNDRVCMMNKELTDTDWV